MKEKRIVTMDAEGKVISIAEHHDLLAEENRKNAETRALIGICLSLGFLLCLTLFRLGFLRSLLN